MGNDRITDLGGPPPHLSRNTSAPAAKKEMREDHTADQLAASFLSALPHDANAFPHSQLQDFLVSNNETGQKEPILASLRKQGYFTYDLIVIDQARNLRLLPAFAFANTTNPKTAARRFEPLARPHTIVAIEDKPNRDIRFPWDRPSKVTIRPEAISKNLPAPHTLESEATPELFARLTKLIPARTYVVQITESQVQIAAFRVQPPHPPTIANWLQSFAKAAEETLGQGPLSPSALFLTGYAGWLTLPPPLPAVRAEEEVFDVLIDVLADIQIPTLANAVRTTASPLPIALISDSLGLARHYAQRLHEILGTDRYSLDFKPEPPATPPHTATSRTLTVVRMVDPMSDSACLSHDLSTGLSQNTSYLIVRFAPANLPKVHIITRELTGHEPTEEMHFPNLIESIPTDHLVTTAMRGVTGDEIFRSAIAVRLRTLQSLADDVRDWSKPLSLRSGLGASALLPHMRKLRSNSELKRLPRPTVVSILLHGQGQEEKQILAQSSAKELDAYFLSPSAMTEEQSVGNMNKDGQSHALVRAFAEAQTLSRTILFIENLDHPRNATFRNQLNRLMEKWRLNQSPTAPPSLLVVMATAERPDVFRDEHFDLSVEVGQPDFSLRLEALTSQLLQPQTAHPDTLDQSWLQSFAKRLTGCWLEDLRQLIQHAHGIAYRRAQVEPGKAPLIRPQDMERALASTSRIHDWEDSLKARFACHHMGHALMSQLTTPPLKTGVVSILRAHPENTTALIAQYRPVRTDTIAAQVRTLLAGKAAEEVMFGPPIIDASDDFLLAVEKVKSLVFQTGYGADWGALLHLAGMPGQQEETTSKSAVGGASLERKIEKNLATHYTAAKDILQKQKPLLEQLTQHLQETEELSPEQFHILLATAQEEQQPPRIVVPESDTSGKNQDNAFFA